MRKIDKFFNSGWNWILYIPFSVLFFYLLIMNGKIFSSADRLTIMVVFFASMIFFSLLNKFFGNFRALNYILTVLGQFVGCGIVFLVFSAIIYGEK